ncbi:MAG: hypothetical protein L3J37_11585 [Rhodobacteraceae bacterium]|nr:hypothetical protein [Paracoccaceae bacterium]
MTKRVLSLGLLFAGFLWVSLLSGCGSGCGDIEDEVFIQKALEHFIASQNETATYYTVDGPKTRVYDVYTSVGEFHAENPNCCSFGYAGDDGALPAWWARANNDYAGTVVIKYNARVVEENGIREEGRSRWISLSSCAAPINPSKLWP